jgi:SAM-dependent methyltransferase
VPIIPFYGAVEPELFAIERRAMDRPGRVIAALNRLLPNGLVIDVGAGDGFTAARLAATTIALEPATGMRRHHRGVRFVGGDAEHLPFRSSAFDGGYATWAYFFTGGGWDPSPGLAELRRVVRPGGRLVIVDNLGGDEFTDFLALPGADTDWWERHGFMTEVVETEFAFESQADAVRLLSRYLGRQVNDAPTSFDYRVGLFVASV